MESFEGKILDSDGQFIANVEGTLHVSTGASGLKSWQGDFSLNPKEGMKFSDYVLILNDGRRGKIHLSNYDPLSETAGFAGNGPLERP